MLSYDFRTGITANGAILYPVNGSIWPPLVALPEDRTVHVAHGYFFIPAVAEPLHTATGRCLVRKRRPDGSFMTVARATPISYAGIPAGRNVYVYFAFQIENLLPDYYDSVVCELRKTDQPSSEVLARPDPPSVRAIGV